VTATAKADVRGHVAQVRILVGGRCDGGEAGQGGSTRVRGLVDDVD